MRVVALSLFLLVAGCSCSTVAHVTPDASAVTDAAPATDAANLRDAAAPTPDWIAAGGFASCASRGGRVWCWGSLWTGRVVPTPLEIPELAGTQQLALTHGHACALTSDGRVACAGSNRTGQLGADPGIVAARDSFEPVPGIENAIEVAVGSVFACALRADGVVLCWGDDALGETGSPITPHSAGTSVAQPTPAAVEGVNDAVAIAAGEYHACAVLEDTTVRCWGYDWFGALGRGAAYTGMPQSVADDVEGLVGAHAIAIDGSSTCVLRDDGSVWCWGASAELFPGYDAATADECTVVVSQICWRAPRPLAGITSALEIRFGGRTGCVTMPSDWQCWGRDDEGQVTGDGTAPALVSDLAVGNGHVCIGDLDGRVSCRGRGVDGQLGDGRFSSSSTLVLPLLR